MRRPLLWPLGHIHLPLTMTDQSPLLHSKARHHSSDPQYDQYCPMDPPLTAPVRPATVVFLAE